MLSLLLFALKFAFMMWALGGFLFGLDLLTGKHRLYRAD